MKNNSNQAGWEADIVHTLITNCSPLTGITTSTATTYMYLQG